MEIAGRKRRKDRKRKKKSAIEPPRMIQSHRVGMKRPQEEGRKSLCMLCTTIITRSSHMPSCTKRLRANSVHTERLAVRHQRICGTSTLQKSTVQYTGA